MKHFRECPLLDAELTDADDVLADPGLFDTRDIFADSDEQTAFDAELRAHHARDNLGNTF